MRVKKPQFSAKLKDGDLVSLKSGRYIRKGRFTGRAVGMYRTARAFTMIDETGVIQKISIPRGIVTAGETDVRVKA